jgi:hypothetical protein
MPKRLIAKTMSGDVKQQGSLHRERRNPQLRQRSQTPKPQNN